MKIIVLTDEQAAWLCGVLDIATEDLELLVLTTMDESDTHKKAMDELDLALNVYHEVLNPRIFFMEEQDAKETEGE